MEQKIMSKPIVFAPKSTGSSEPRDVRDRFADFINLKDFGAVGDGVTNDTTAWRAWQTAIKNGGMAYAPKGDYLIDNEILHIPNGYIGNKFYTPTYNETDTGDIINDSSYVVYVDFDNGDDSNSGMTENDAVKTITKAASLIKSFSLHANSNRYGDGYFENLPIMVLAGTTYNENVLLSNIQCVLLFKGDVVINGKIWVNKGSVINFYQDSHTLTIISNNLYENFGISESCAAFTGEVILSGSNITNSIRVIQHGYVVFLGNVTFNVSNSSRYIEINLFARATFEKKITLTGSNCTNAIVSEYFAFCEIRQGIEITSPLTSHCICAYRFGGILIHGNVIVRSNGGNMLRSDNCGYIACDTFTDSQFYRETGNNSTLFYCSGNSYLAVSNGSSGKITMSMGEGSSSDSMFYTVDNSVGGINTQTLIISGGCHCVLWSRFESYIYFRAVTISGSLTGMKYASTDLSIINSNGLGENGMPGSTSGVTERGGIFM